MENAEEQMHLLRYFSWKVKGNIISLFSLEDLNLTALTYINK